MSESSQRYASGRQGKLLEVFVVFDICIDSLPDDLRSFLSKLVEPLAVFFFVALRFFLLSGTRISSDPKHKKLHGKDRETSRPWELLLIRIKSKSLTCFRG